MVWGTPWLYGALHDAAALHGAVSLGNKFLSASQQSSYSMRVVTNEFELAPLHLVSLILTDMALGF
jgi:hypothetical protein